jgi:hypothetical protein
MVRTFLIWRSRFLSSYPVSEVICNQYYTLWISSFVIQMYVLDCLLILQGMSDAKLSPSIITIQSIWVYSLASIKSREDDFEFLNYRSRHSALRGYNVVY